MDGRRRRAISRVRRSSSTACSSAQRAWRCSRSYPVSAPALTSSFSVMRLAGEKALVTGSTAGIGRAIATEFAREGAGVVVTGRNRERGESVVAVINAAGGETRDARVAELDTAEWEAILRIDLTAPFWCARAAIPHMRRAG